MSLPSVEAVTEALALWDDILKHHPGSDLAYYTVLDAARMVVDAVEFDAPHTVDVPGHYLLIKVRSE